MTFIAFSVYLQRKIHFSKKYQTLSNPLLLNKFLIQQKNCIAHKGNLTAK